MSWDERWKKYEEGVVEGGGIVIVGVGVEGVETVGSLKGGCEMDGDEGEGAKGSTMKEKKSKQKQKQKRKKWKTGGEKKKKPQSCRRLCPL